jgi:hypothetical protein
LQKKPAGLAMENSFFILVLGLLSLLLYYARREALALVKEQYNKQQGAGSKD